MPRFHTDSHLWLTVGIAGGTRPEAWVPHRSLGQPIEVARSDVRSDVKMVWVPSHRPKGAVAAGPQGRSYAFGNHRAEDGARASRTEELASRPGRYDVRLLDLALEQGALPEPSPF